MNRTQEEIGRLNAQLRDRTNEEGELRITFEGRPAVKILSLEPLQYETYGLIRRGPKLMGKFVLSALFSEPKEDDRAMLWIAFQTGEDEIYAHPEKSADVANDLGRLITSDLEYDVFK